MECTNPECSRCNPEKTSWCAGCLEHFAARRSSTIITGSFPLTTDRRKVYRRISKMGGGEHYTYSYRMRIE